MERRYDVDWLRVFAIALLIVYHIGIGFQPWGGLFGFLVNEDSFPGLWPAMSVMNVWRIPLLFAISGMGVAFAMRKRNVRQLIGERFRRILLPFIIGSLTIVPLHLLIWAVWYKQDITYIPSPGHLWFLANIFVYVLLCLPLFYFLRRREGQTIQRRVQFLFKSPIGWALMTILIIVEVILVNPDSYTLYVFNLHGFILGLIAFIFGFLLIYCQEVAGNMLIKYRWLYSALAIALYFFRWIVFDLEAPYPLMAIETATWIFAAFALARKYLNRNSKILRYLTPAAYPVYVVHMLVLYAGSYILFPMNLPAELKFIILSIFTYAGCIGLYEVWRRVKRLWL